MKLIERRIGLLFAVFLGLLVIGAGKAAWLGVVKAGTLKRAAATGSAAVSVVWLVTGATAPGRIPAGACPPEAISWRAASLGDCIRSAARRGSVCGRAVR